ncbi:hypothetical protein AX15_000108 [Amanita polypyramis BW_CC]|nr:hypothetical protein AX15_000108 [Amanita polypyramis BW_CC]
MVFFYSSTAVDPPVTLYMGRDKFENEDLIKYAWPQDVWFHVDKLSSAHVYLRMPESMTWEAIPDALLMDCAQLVKANSIEGKLSRFGKKDNLTIIYTPGDNLKKTGDMDVGQVSFHNEKKARMPFVALLCINLSQEMHVPKRENVIVNRLNKTKVEREVNHEQERIDRLKEETAKKRAAAAERRKAELELVRAREAEKAARSYDSLFNAEEDASPQESVQEMMDDFMILEVQRNWYIRIGDKIISETPYHVKLVGSCVATMSYRLKGVVELQQEESSLDDSSEEDLDDGDENWDDWVSDSFVQPPCRSLFDDATFPSVEDAIHHDQATHGFNLDQICKKISLDIHGRIRLVNYIRKNRVSSTDAQALTGTEPFFSSDEYLTPVIEDDALLQGLPDWTDSEDEDANIDPNRKVRVLQRQLVAAKQDLIDYRQLVTQGIDTMNLTEVISESKLTNDAENCDNYYFQSYEENEIHAVMIQDKVRTSAYAHFILANPTLFRDAVVLDVGCGTGILSLFAAKAGAKQVFAVEASDMAEKARGIVKANGLDDIITVIKGKVEEITLPDGVEKVDIIVSEWMGYALLYESMLDSVLHARGRFLKPDGVMAPSQCRMNLALGDVAEIYKERIDFWNDVYGFDMSIMAEGIYDEAVVDVVGPNSLCSEPFTIKDICLRDVMTHQLDFSSDFTLTSTAEQRSKINAFVLYFDVFFNPSGQEVPEGTKVHVIKEGQAVVAELWPVGGKPASKRRQSSAKPKCGITSFSTGPQSTPTHWKQALFMLRDPIWVTEGTVISGTLYCHKNRANSRELDIEIHYRVQGNDTSQNNAVNVQIFKVR